eukprot:UN09061
MKDFDKTVYLNLKCFFILKIYNIVLTFFFCI